MSRTVARKAGVAHQLARHPEWWTWALIVGAWVSMAPHLVPTLAAGADVCACCGRGSFLEEFGAWTRMVVAMMFPALIGRVRFVANTNLPRRRHASIAIYLVGFLAPWLALGVPTVTLQCALAAAPNGGTTATGWGALLFGVASLWTLTPWHRGMHRRCAPGRVTAIRGARWAGELTREGARSGIACLGTCWPAMLACALTGHGAAAMLGGLWLGLWLRFRRPSPSGRVALGHAALGLWYGAQAWLAQ